MSSRFVSLSIVPVTALLLIGAVAITAPRAQRPAADVAIDADDIGGVVSSSNGPEAGVWVIAETRELGVRCIKSVVTRAGPMNGMGRCRRPVGVLRVREGCRPGYEIPFFTSAWEA